jgi:spoIIIJ-associated protein
MQPEAPPANPKASRAEVAKDRAPMARDLLLELFRLLGLPVEVSLREGGDEIALHAKVGEGADAAGLSGERPAMQEPLAYLLSKMVNRGLPDGGPRAFVKLSFGDAVPTEQSAQGLGEDTDPEIVALGKELAERASKLGKTLTVGPMTARERRSIHLAVKEAGGATTRSEGDGLQRRILIVPETLGAASPGNPAAGSPREER